MRSLEDIAKAMVAGIDDDLKAELNEWMFTQLADKVVAQLAKAYPTPERNMSRIETWWIEKLVSGHLLPGRGWLIELPVSELVDDYIAEVRRPEASHRGCATAMGRFLQKVCPSIGTSSRKAEVVTEAGASCIKRVRFYNFPNLEICRMLWDRKFGPMDWKSLDAQAEAAAAE